MKTFECDYQSSPTNGHWHLTKQDADQCIERWEKWRTAPFRASRSQRNGIRDYSNKPLGAVAKDHGFYTN